MVAALERRDADPNVDSVVFTNNDTTGPTQGHTYATAGHLQTDDVGTLWLQDQSESNKAAVVAQPKSNTALIFGDGALRRGPRSRRLHPAERRRHLLRHCDSGVRSGSSGASSRAGATVITTDFEAGVLLIRATCREGTSAFASGK